MTTASIPPHSNGSGTHPMDPPAAPLPPLLPPSSRARDRLAAIRVDLGARMARHPIATLLLGLGAGYLVARLRARK